MLLKRFRKVRDRCVSGATSRFIKPRDKTLPDQVKVFESRVPRLAENSAEFQWNYSAVKPNGEEVRKRKLVYECSDSSCRNRCRCASKRSKITGSDFQVSSVNMSQVENVPVNETIVNAHHKRTGDVKGYSEGNSCLDYRYITGHSYGMFERVSRADTTVTRHNIEVKYAVKKTLKPRMGKSSLISSSEIKNPTAVRNEETNKTTHQSRHKRFHRSIPGGQEKCLTGDISSSVDRHVELAKNIKHEIAYTNHREDKEAILNRYFADYLMYQSPCQQSRGRADGAESDADASYSHLRRGDGSSFTCNQFNIKDNDVWNVPSKSTDDVSNISSDSGQEDCGDFDVAFIDMDEHNDITLPYRKLVDYSLTESDISDIVGDELDDLTNLSSVSDFVRSVFNDNVSEEYDDVIDSFMNSKLSDDISDEGLSSLGSDDDN